ncbi:unnamed protein product [Cylicocyclus nassatus]|uniref:Protein kinase domain-containing protein n=1 Tax=Cylicocyclus nassatus TaxID=53992 RepID=A0AA36MA91_CYLNA|nr:unnamed protein product [Cylicocyclus nassatus]
MLPRTQLPSAIPEDSEWSEDDEVPPIQAPPTRAFRRLSSSVPSRKHTPYLQGIKFSHVSAEDELKLEDAVPEKVEEKSIDEESTKSSNRSRTPSSTYEFPCPRLSDIVVANMIKLSVLSEGRSRFGIVSKYINKTTMANYAVVEWDIKTMDKKSLDEVICQLEYVSTLRHKRIGSVYGYHVSDGRLMIFRTFLPTGAVADQLKLAPLAENTATKFFCQLLEALDFLHKRNVTHGDIKTSNLLVTLSGDIQVTDISLPNAPKHENHMRRTLLHCAPEMFETAQSWENATPATDIWAAGCVLVAMVTRCAPFQDLFLSLSTQELHEALMKAHHHESTTQLSYTSHTLIPTSSKELADMVDATLVEDPSKRLQAEELLERFFTDTSKSRRTSRKSRSSTRISAIIREDKKEHHDLYNDGPVTLATGTAHKNLLERLYESAERRSDEEENPLLYCMKWYGSRLLIFVLLLLKWVAMVFLAALSLGFVAGSVFLSIYVIYSGIGVICQCQLNEGRIGSRCKIKESSVT